MTSTTTRQARQNRRRVPSAQGLESRAGRRVDGFRSSAVGAGDDANLAAPGSLALRRLAHLLASYAPHDGVFQLRLPGTYAIRLSRMTTEATYSTLGPALCVAAQGAKAVMLGREVLEYDPAHLLVFAVDLPVSSQVIRATRKDPYLGFTLEMDPTRVAELAARVYPRGIPKASDSCGLYVGRANDAIVDAVTRLLELMAHPEDADLLGPLVVDEILLRLLRTPMGTRVAQIGQPKSGVQRICRSGVLDTRAFRPAGHRRRDGHLRPHERIVVPSAFQSRDFDEPAAVPEGPPTARGSAFDALSENGRERCVPPRRLSECVPVQQGVRPILWKRPDERHRETSGGRIRISRRSALASAADAPPDRFFIVASSSDAHTARHETTQPATNVVTYFAPPGSPLRIDAPNPGTCPF